MAFILPRPGYFVKERFLKRFRNCGQAMVRIHVILDNYGIHSSNIIGVALANFAWRVRLHFLPPYSPDDNAIERVWKDLHANVTRNHNCATMTELMANVRYYLRKRNRRTLTIEVFAAAA